MRLQDWEVTAIKQAFLNYFAKGDQLWVFGSRVDDTLKGGDIDLYVETKMTDVSEILQKKRRFSIAIQDAIGEQKIDVVIERPGYNLPIHQEARKTGIQI